jgi:hypothetical protein
MRVRRPFGRFTLTRLPDGDSLVERAMGHIYRSK